MVGGETMADTAVGAAPVYDPFDPAFHEDPYPTWNALREHEPLHRTPMGIYVLTRYEDVWRLLRDRRCGRDIPLELVKFAAGDGPGAEMFMSNMLNREGPDHTRLRKLMALPFTPGRVRELRQRTRALVEDLLLDVDGEFDVARDLALVLPVLVICELLGLPSEDRDVVRPWATAMADASVMFPSDEAKRANDDALVSFCAYFEDLIAGRRPYADDGLFAALVAAEADGDRLDHEELVVNATLLFFAGFETTTNLIGNGMLALLRHPDELARLRDDRALLPSAVEEMLRYDGPLQTAPRITHEPIETSVGTIKANRVIELGIAAANHDPRQFDEPERFDVGRTDNAHVAFGSGAHFCLGAHLARLEANVAFDTILDTFSAIELAGAPVRKAAPGIRGLESLPVAVTRA